MREASTDLQEIEASGSSLPDPDDFAKDFRSYIDIQGQVIRGGRGLLEVWPSPTRWLVFGFFGVVMLYLPLLTFRAYELAFTYDRYEQLASAWKQAVSDDFPFPRLNGNRLTGVIFLGTGWVIGQTFIGALLGWRRRLIQQVTVATALIVAVGGIAIAWAKF